MFRLVLTLCHCTDNGKQVVGMSGDALDALCNSCDCTFRQTEERMQQQQ